MTNFEVNRSHVKLSLEKLNKFGCKATKINKHKEINRCQSVLLLEAGLAHLRDWKNSRTRPEKKTYQVFLSFGWYSPFHPSNGLSMINCEAMTDWFATKVVLACCGPCYKADLNLPQSQLCRKLRLLWTILVHSYLLLVNLLFLKIVYLYVLLLNIWFQ